MRWKAWWKSKRMLAYMEVAFFSLVLAWFHHVIEGAETITNIPVRGWNYSSAKKLPMLRT